MEDWNVIISVKERGFTEAMNALRRFGRVDRTDFYNVLVMRVDDINAFLEKLRERVSVKPDYLHFVSRLVPVTVTFFFTSPDEFEDRAGEAVMLWVPLLAGKKFHVRMHRRGFKGTLSSLDEERFLDTFILKELGREGQTARVSFEDPDYVIAVETLNDRAGLSLWSREEIKKYPFIRPD